MDEQSYNARFESMRKRPGGHSLVSKNKQLLYVHKDLDKRCANMIQKHKHDTRYFEAGIRREQLMLEKRHESLEKQKQKCDRQRQQTHYLLESSQRLHLAKEQTRLFQRAPSARKYMPTEIDVIQEIMKLTMPTHMKQRLARITYLGFEQQKKHLYSWLGLMIVYFRKIIKFYSFFFKSILWNSCIDLRTGVQVHEVHTVVPTNNTHKHIIEYNYFHNISMFWKIYFILLIYDSIMKHYEQL